jgi:hypothetical protein
VRRPHVTLVEGINEGNWLKIFLGYPSEHEKAAWEVYEFLAAQGDEVWFDKKSLVAGIDWDKERERGQREAELIIHLCSDAILRRAGVVNREIRQTLRLVEDQPIGALYVIPIRLDAMKLPVELTRFQYIDFDSNWKERLAEGVAKRRTQLVGNVLSAPTQQPFVEEKTTKGLQKIELEDVTDGYECRGEYLRFNEEDLYWTAVNSSIASHVLGGYFGVRGDFARWVGRPLDARKHEWSVKTEEFFRSGEMLSIRFYHYIGFAGAAHPNHYIRTLNFFGRDAGSLEIERLLGHSSDQARKVISYCENVIVAGFEGEVDKSSFFAGYKEDERQLWALLGQFGFDRNGLIFNFSPYAVLPYAFGAHEVHVPWRLLNIPDEYRDLVEKLRA